MSAGTSRSMCFMKWRASRCRWQTIEGAAVNLVPQAIGPASSGPVGQRPNHGAVEHVERREQGSRAVADIVMGLGAALGRLERQARPSAAARLPLLYRRIICLRRMIDTVERLDLVGPLYGPTLLDQEHSRMTWGCQVHIHDVRGLGDELGGIAALEGADALQLQPMGDPDPLNDTQGQAGGSTHHQLTQRVTFDSSVPVSYCHLLHNCPPASMTYDAYQPHQRLFPPALAGWGNSD